MGRRNGDDDVETPEEEERRLLAWADRKNEQDQVPQEVVDNARDAPNQPPPPPES